MSSREYLDFESKEPPRIAGWLLALFTPVQELDALLGDLQEESSGLARTSGGSFARRWYWRQTLKTIQDSILHSFRDAPLQMVVTVTVGFWLIGVMSRFSQQAMRSFLDAHQIYSSHPEAYLFWLKFPLEIGRVITCALVGAVVAVAAKRREMPAAIGVSVVQMSLFGIAVVAVLARGEQWLRWFVFMLTWNSICSIATVLGALAVRIRRSPPPRQNVAIR